MSKRPKKTIAKDRREPSPRTLLKHIHELQNKYDRHPEVLKDRLRGIRGVPSERLLQELIDTKRLTQFKGTKQYECGDFECTCVVELDGHKYEFNGVYYQRDGIWMEKDFRDGDDYDDMVKEILEEEVEEDREEMKPYAMALALASLWARYAC